MLSLVEYASSDSDGETSDPEITVTGSRLSLSPDGPIRLIGCASRKNVETLTSKPVLITVPSMSEGCHPSSMGEDSPPFEVLPSQFYDLFTFMQKCSLPFADNDDEPAPKRSKASMGTGLFSMLPAPKNTITKMANRSLVPHSVSKQQSTAAASASTALKNVKSTLSSSSDKLTYKDEAAGAAEDDDDGGDAADFFSLDNVTKDTGLASPGVADSSEDADVQLLPTTSAELVSTTTTTCADNYQNHDQPDGSALANAPLQFDAGWVSSSNIDVEHASSSTDRQAAYDAQVYYKVDGSEVDCGSSSSSSSLVDPTSMFNDEGFLRMVGKSRHKREDNIQIVDVAQDDQLPKYDEWLTKALTEDVGNRPSRKKGFMPTSQQRRKHQITYLAFQAREREVELKNQWAENRLSRRQTQSKYGF